MILSVALTRVDVKQQYYDEKKALREEISTLETRIHNLRERVESFPLYFLPSEFRKLGA